MSEGVVEIKNLSRKFGNFYAVKNISFSFKKGEIFGFIGPNGAGKSTAMRILASLDLPTKGDCFINGLSTSEYADKIRPLIGYMPDDYGTYPNMTVFEYLDFFARAYKLNPEKRDASVEGVLEFCQLTDLREKKITSLSKGMKQRLCLGRCIIHDPDILILDEPSAGLDPRARIEFRDLLKILAAQGKSIFISSHILAELEEMCDAVAIIEQGKIVAQGSIKEVKARVRDAHEENVKNSDDIFHVIEIRLSDEHERFEQILAEQTDIDEYQMDGKNTVIQYRGDSNKQSILLKRLIEAGLPICHFATRDANLEDVFMHLTEGKVQ